MYFLGQERGALWLETQQGQNPDVHLQLCVLGQVGDLLSGAEYTMGSTTFHSKANGREEEPCICATLCTQQTQ